MKITLYYIAFARMPTEKAHGLTIAKSCESFAKAGASVTLVVPRRKTSMDGDLFSVYGVERNFTVCEIAVPDLIGRFGMSRIAFFVHYIFFYIAVGVRLLFASRGMYIYTREAPFCLLAWIGYRVSLEPHQISSHRKSYFFLARRAHRLFPISGALKSTFLGAGFDATRILVTPSGVDLSVFDIDISQADARRRLDLPIGGKIAVYTGNFTTMDQDKGLNDIIEALKEVPDVLFVAAGGSGKDIERYSEVAQEKGVAGQVILRGYVSQKKLAIYQKAADMLLMPFPDTPHYRKHMSPVKMFEYMASERPIIASDLPTIREVLNESNASVVAPGDTKALSISITACTVVTPEITLRTKNAKRDVQAFTWENRAKRILAHLP